MTDSSGNPLQLMLVHAHPDDETTTTGATIARYAAEGVGVELVMCTRGVGIRPVSSRSLRLSGRPDQTFG